MSIVFGFEPYNITVVLARGSSFSAAILAEKPWPDGVMIELRFADHRHPDTPIHQWPAEVGSEQATWDVPAADVDEVITDQARLASLIWTTDSGQPITWGKGPARVV